MNPTATTAPDRPAGAPPAVWDAELFVLRGDTFPELRRRVADLAAHVESHPDVSLKDLAYSVNAALAPAGCRLAVVAGSAADLHKRLARAGERLADPKCRQIKDSAGAYYFAEPLHPRGKVAFLFPGEGAQYFNMMLDLFPHFAEVRDTFADCEQRAERMGYGPRAITRLLTLPPGATAEERGHAERELRKLSNAMISVLVADWAMFQLFGGLGLPVDVMAGHSMGELAALWASGAIEDMYHVLPSVLDWMNGLQQLEDAGGQGEATLLAVGAGRAVADEVIAASGVGDAPVSVAMDNCPHQVVIVGPRGPMAAVEAGLQGRRILFEKLPFGRPYHTPLFEPALGPLRKVFADVPFRRPAVPVYSSTTAAPFPDDAAAMRRLTVDQWASPVRFTEMIANMHAAGVRLFVEAGPRGNLSAFVEDTLRGQPFAAIAGNGERRSGLLQLHHLAAQLAAHHVPLQLDRLYQGRNPRRVAWEPAARAEPVNRISGAEVQAEPAGQTSPSADQPGPAARAYPPSASAVPAGAAPAAHPGRAQVMGQYLAVMDQFLDTQREMTEQFLALRHRPRPRRVVRHPAPPAPLPEYGERGEQPSTLSPYSAREVGGEASPNPPAVAAPALPLLGEIVRREANEVVVRRRLDLAEDRFAADHTVGGRNVSKVDPDQHGLPIMPMTFTVEMMAEVATLLRPGKVVVRVEQVKLFRWLPFDADEPITVEVTARDNGGASVAVELRDLGSASASAQTRAVAAQAVVVFADRYPEPPVSEPLRLTNDRPCRIPLEVLYKNLFHGPLFQGVLSTGRVGDEGIESPVVVLPRRELFASQDDPQFLMDPVLLDVIMHPTAAWHLEQADQSGRILLPVELGSVELFGPRPAEGTRLVSRVTLADQSARHFTNAFDVAGADGRLWCRVRGMRYWRFYVPFGDVNFHGPKDEYFISRPWREARERPELAVRRTPSGRPFTLIVLEPSADLLQAAMRRITAKVVLNPAEAKEFRGLNGREPRVLNDWLVGRIAAKDAARVLWHHARGERLYPADILLETTGDTTARACCLTAPEGTDCPITAVAHLGDLCVGLGTFAPRAGVALARPGQDTGALSPEELALLQSTRGDRSEWVTRCLCARRAVEQALGRAGRVTAVDPVTGVLTVDAGGPVLAYTDRDGELIAGWTLGETEAA